MKFTKAVKTLKQLGYSIHEINEARVAGSKGVAVIDVCRNGREDKVAGFMVQTKSQLSSGPLQDYNFGTFCKTMSRALDTAARLNSY